MIRKRFDIRSKEFGISFVPADKRYQSKWIELVWISRRVMLLTRHISEVTKRKNENKYGDTNEVSPHFVRRRKPPAMPGSIQGVILMPRK